MAGAITLTSRAWAQQEQAQILAVTIPDLLKADEASVKAAWTKLKEQLAEAEATSPEAVIPLYGQFLDQGGARYASVAIDVTSRVAGLYATDLHQIDKAIEAYDWGIATYRRDPNVSRLQAERQDAVRAQGEQERRNDQGGMGLVAPLKIETPKTVAGITVPNLRMPDIAVTPVGVSQAVASIEAKSGATLPIAPVIVAPLNSNSVFFKPPVNVSAIGAPVEAAKPLLNSASVVRQPLPLVRAPFATLSKSPSQATTLVAPVAFAAPSLALPARPGNYLGWKPGEDRCVTALVRQKSGRLWVGTEDNGVWYYDEMSPETARWKQFRTSDGLGDDSTYAIAVDQQDRVWVGTLNHGVSVWNGKTWQNYGVLDGLLGERVFDIAVCPTDGDVWIATNAGLTRYSQGKDNWTYFTKSDGLPSNQVQTLAFDKRGNLIIGSRCDGIALASASDAYRKWRVVRGPESLPASATGRGLPSNLINDTLFAQDGTIYVATVNGLAWSRDQGTNWSYVRGKDYAAKIKGLYAGPPVGWKAEPDVLPMEDYVSCLAEDEAGQIWLGHWNEGNEVLGKANVGGMLREVVVDGPEIRNLHFAGQERSGFVRAILPVGNGEGLVARYDEGLSRAKLAPDIPSPSGRLAIVKSPHSDKKNQIQFLQSGFDNSFTSRFNSVAFPTAASTPSEKELELLLENVRLAANSGTKFDVIPLSDDWTTQGDWLGRYGRHFAVLCAMNSPYDYVWGAGKEEVQYALSINPREKGNGLRYWVHWLYTSNSRVLEMPPVYNDSRRVRGLTKDGERRRQSEVDDNGEVYPLSKEGPNIYVSIKIPAGNYVLSFYNHNKDGYSGLNRLRDYKISLRDHPSNVPLNDVHGFETWPELSHNRQLDFRGGVYQRYLVSGPRSITVEYAKNSSYNTILTGIFLDKVDTRSGGQEPEPYFLERFNRFVPFDSRRDQAGTAMKLWDELENARIHNPQWWASEGARYYGPLIRWYENTRKLATSPESPEMLARLGTCYYHINSFPKWEETQRKRKLIPARDIEFDLHFDEATIKNNGGPNFSGQGRKAVVGHLSRMASGVFSAANSAEIKVARHTNEHVD